VDEIARTVMEVEQLSSEEADSLLEKLRSHEN
jgi:hypothetical protein